MGNNGKLCILRLSAIGDVCHAVAMVERIQTARPDIEITWIIGKVEHQLVCDIPGVKFILFDKSKGRRAYLDLKQALKGQYFDTLFLMQVALRANIASLFIKAKVKVGFDSERSKELHRLFVSETISPQQHPHVLDGFMAFADSIGIAKTEKPRWHIPMPEEARQFAESLDVAPGKYAVICPSASKSERNWTVAGYQQTASYLQQCGFDVLLCGGPAKTEKALADKIAAGGQVSLNLVGKTRLKELLAVLANARLVVAPDTGPAHMATSVGTPVVGLYAHSNPRRTGPYNNIGDVASVYDDVIAEQKGADWRSLRWGTRAKGEDLMTRITFGQVQACIDRLLY